MSHHTFSLSPAYDAGRKGSGTVAVSNNGMLLGSSNAMRTWTFVYAVMLASMIAALVWIA
jgi:hypothetical protein